MGNPIHNLTNSIQTMQIDNQPNAGVRRRVRRAVIAPMNNNVNIALVRPDPRGFVDLQNANTADAMDVDTPPPAVAAQPPAVAAQPPAVAAQPPLRNLGQAAAAHRVEFTPPNAQRRERLQNLAQQLNIQLRALQD